MLLDGSGNPVYYLTDSMGSVIGMVDESGNSVVRYIYDAFGNVLNSTGTSSDVTGGDFRFQGQWRESESGLYYFHARDYDAETGLFLSRDGVDVQQQQIEAFNPYQFAFNNPLVYVDPTGLFTINEIGVANAVENILNNLKTAAINQIKDRTIDRARGILTNVLNSALKQCHHELR